MDWQASIAASASTPTSRPSPTGLLTPANEDDPITDEMLAENEIRIGELRASMPQTDPFGEAFSDRSWDDESDEDQQESLMEWTLTSDDAETADTQENEETAGMTQTADGVQHPEDAEEVPPDRPHLYFDELARRVDNLSLRRSESFTAEDAEQIWQRREQEARQDTRFLRQSLSNRLQYPPGDQDKLHPSMQIVIRLLVASLMNSCAHMEAHGRPIVWPPAQELIAASMSRSLFDVMVRLVSHVHYHFEKIVTGQKLQVAFSAAQQRLLEEQEMDWRDVVDLVLAQIGLHRVQQAEHHAEVAAGEIVPQQAEEE